MQYIPRHLAGYANFGHVCQKLIYEPCHLGSYWTKIHEIFTSLMLLSAHLRSDIPFCLGMPVPQSWLPWQRFLRYRKKKVSLIICHSIPSIWCKTVNIIPAHPEIILLLAKKVCGDFQQFVPKIGYHSNVP